MRPLMPGATIGIIGAGQLARMMLLEARRMGYRGWVLAASEHDPAVALADGSIVAEVDDLAAAGQLARAADVVTVDTEHVPARVLAQIEALVPVRPSWKVLDTIQDRRAQRAFLTRIGGPQPTCLAVDSREELEANARIVGFPCVLKSRRAGYDGKGQTMIRRAEELAAAWDVCGGQAAMLEEFIEFEREISVLLARTPAGEVAYYPIAHNVHRDHMLSTTVAPAVLDTGMEEEARAIAGRIAEALEHVGMLAVELFVVARDRSRQGERSSLLVNEIAPRPHNSGHYTFGACFTSQFEQHVRAIAGLPLGDPSLVSPAAMVNLFGDLWHDGEPDWMPVLSCPQARLHLYGKREPRLRRKMGHVLVLEADPAQALRRAGALLQQVTRSV